MCDYSLMSIPNRLARDGEALATHRFPGGTIGLASCADLEADGRGRNTCRSFWSMLKDAFTMEPPSIPAVCVPPGSRLFLTDIPDYIQEEVGGSDTGQDVVFTETTATPNTHRDAFRFANGREILLQRFSEGLHVIVLSTGLEDVRAGEPVEQHQFR